MNVAAPAGYAEHWYTMVDGIRIYCRDYGDDLSPRTPAICLPGLTRNSKDFHWLAMRLASERRVLAVDFRGRGRSDYDPRYKNYVPPTYVRDVLDVAAATGVHRAVVIGTSLGGLVAMGIAVARPTFLAGVVMNDIGPEIRAAAIARIASYSGKKSTFATWAEAIAECKSRYAIAHPGKTDAEWEELTRDSFVEKDGRIVPDYDVAIAKAGSGDGLPDMWPLFGALQNIPVLAVRGALSDVLAQDTFDKMATVKPDLERVTVPNCGHNPGLSEPEVTAALEAFLARIDARDGRG
jgi:pimeloyl-ACP methyl ester carboxylesterase